MTARVKRKGEKEHAIWGRTGPFYEEQDSMSRWMAKG
jgi:hypothetical protein